MADLTNDDQQLFADWVRDHGRAVRGFLFGMVRRWELADDLCQEVFCRAWQNRRRYREQGSDRAYLLRIADRLVCDHARRAKPPLQLDDEAWTMHAPTDSEMQPPQALVAAEESGRLAEALGALSAMQRRVLLMRYFGEMNFTDIATAIGCPLNTTLSHAHRGLQRLRTLLVGLDADRRI